MAASPRAPAARFLEQEARAMLTRLARVKPFALLTPAVPSATVSVPAQAAIEGYLATRRRELRSRIDGFLAWIRGPEAAGVPAAAMQRRFTFLRLRFNVVLQQFDIFAEALTQRSEHETGVFIAGLDAVAQEALELPGVPMAIPPVVCYLVRDPGAAIRRARTRLPGGGENPVAVIRVPRERMVGSGVSSSLVHEVGHQGAALLGLVETLRPVLQARQGAEARGLRVGEGADAPRGQGVQEGRRIEGPAPRAVLLMPHDLLHHDRLRTRGGVHRPPVRARRRAGVPRGAAPGAEAAKAPNIGSAG